jgi:hypothetical protein
MYEPVTGGIFPAATGPVSSLDRTAPPGTSPASGSAAIDLNLYIHLPAEAPSRRSSLQTFVSSPDSGGDASEINGGGHIGGCPFTGGA